MSSKYAMILDEISFNKLWNDPRITNCEVDFDGKRFITIKIKKSVWFRAEFLDVLILDEDASNSEVDEFYNYFMEYYE